MARIENTSGRQFDITIKGKTFQIPAGKGGDGRDQNGVGEIDDDLFADAKENDTFVKALLDSGELVAKSGKVASKAEPASPKSDHGDDSKAFKK